MLEVTSEVGVAMGGASVAGSEEGNFIENILYYFKKEFWNGLLV